MNFDIKIMNTFENLIRIYKLLRHIIIKFFFIKEKSFEDNLMQSLNSKGYYVCKEGEIDFEKLSSIIKRSIQKYFPSNSGDTRLYGIDDESIIVKENFYKILDSHKNRIKTVSTIKKLYLHCTMGGYLKNKKDASSGGGWHRDHHFELFKVMIYISDVNEQNGPFSYIEKSHSKINQLLTLFFLKLFSKNITRYSEDSINLICKIFNYKKKIFLGKKGTCIIFNSSGIHRGLEISGGERLALTAYIYPYTDNEKILHERSKHMNIPDSLRKKNIKDYVQL